MLAMRLGQPKDLPFDHTIFLVFMMFINDVINVYDYVYKHYGRFGSLNWAFMDTFLCAVL